MDLHIRQALAHDVGGVRLLRSNSRRHVATAFAPALLLAARGAAAEADGQRTRGQPFRLPRGWDGGFAIELAARHAPGAGAARHPTPLQNGGH